MQAGVAEGAQLEATLDCTEVRILLVFGSVL